ncbi:cilia- and flagella-associated protein 100-like [Dicentrarchus labrax]|uniref:cilia- and flagella-associated protein 100-like n=1 Tax=Dicentrarchus labrax TaxID=13489 RepID=UPI0021F502D8|nr:cilia- and flagella-associated protein 100-like [Dicentrarchus labrax]
MSGSKKDTFKNIRGLDENEQQRIQLEASLLMSRSEIKKLNKTIAAEQLRIQNLEQILEQNKDKFQKVFKTTEKKCSDARTLLENEHKSKAETIAEVEKLTDEIGNVKSDLSQTEDILNRYKRYKKILFKLSPPEWQEAQEAEAFKATVPSNRDPQDEQDEGPQESADRQGSERGVESSPGRVLPSTGESTLSSVHSDTLVTNYKEETDSSKYEDKLELYFSDPQQLLVLMTDLTDQNLSLIQNSTRMDETLEELQQTFETASKEMKEDEERLTLQVTDMQEKIDRESERAAELQKKVQLHDSLKTEDQDVLLDALGKKVTEVHRCCLDSRLSHLSTLEKLSSVEYRMSLLLQLIENIPEESLEALRQIKDSERMSRLREEQLRLEREKQRERMKKCMQRSLGDSKKKRGRKLMSRCFPVEQKTKVSDEEDSIPAEDELQAYLFTNEGAE